MVYTLGLSLINNLFKANYKSSVSVCVMKILLCFLMLNLYLIIILKVGNNVENFVSKSDNERAFFKDNR